MPIGRAFPWFVSKGQKHRRHERLRPTRTPEPAFTLRHTNTLAYTDANTHTTHLYCMRKREAVYIGGYRILPLGTVGDSPNTSKRGALQALTNNTAVLTCCIM